MAKNEIVFTKDLKLNMTPLDRIVATLIFVFGTEADEERDALIDAELRNAVIPSVHTAMATSSLYTRLNEDASRKVFAERFYKKVRAHYVAKGVLTK